MKSVYERFILISEFFTAVIIGVGDVEPLNPRHSTPSVKLFEVITMKASEMSGYDSTNLWVRNRGSAAG